MEVAKVLQDPKQFVVGGMAEGDEVGGELLGQAQGRLVHQGEADTGDSRQLSLGVAGQLMELALGRGDDGGALAGARHHGRLVQRGEGGDPRGIHPQLDHDAFVGHGVHLGGLARGR